MREIGERLNSENERRKRATKYIHAKERGQERKENTDLPT